MAYLNANIPPTYAQIRKEYLYDLKKHKGCLLYTSPSPRDPKTSRMPSSA